MNDKTKKFEIECGSLKKIVIAKTAKEACRLAIKDFDGDLAMCVRLRTTGTPWMYQDSRVAFNITVDY